MRGAIPPLPNTPSWSGAQLKHRDNLPLHELSHTVRRATGALHCAIRAPSISSFIVSITVITKTYQTR
jgi:hypothetical protein